MSPSTLPTSRARRTSLIAAGSVLALVATLAACGDDADPAADPATSAATDTSESPAASASGSPSESSTAAATGEMPSVEGGFGETPTITVPDSEPPSELVVETLTKGNGPAVEAGETIVVNYAGVRWDDGNIFDSSFDRGSPAGFGIGVGAVIPGWDSGLVGLKAGTRVLMVLPPDQAYGDESPGDPIQAGDTLVFVVDVLGSHAGNETAKGEPAPTEDDSLPYVSITPKAPEIIIPAGSPPKQLIKIPVVVGSGPKVQKGDTVVVQYKGVLWRNGKEFDASWGRGQPFVTAIGQGAVIPAWDKGLVGQTVGSRVMLVVPPKDGYGDAGSGQIKGTDTMVFAVDILGAY
ncbi:MAG: FKBP-type peptidyl-prolyl cis-trans isomerase [Actinomycetes bacterium]